MKDKLIITGLHLTGFLAGLILSVVATDGSPAHALGLSVGISCGVFLSAYVIANVIRRFCLEGKQ